MTTLLRICEAFEITVSKLAQGLDEDGVYEALVIPGVPRKRALRRIES